MSFGLIDRFLDGITMYRLVLYYLILLLVGAVGLSAFGYLGYSPLAIMLSSVYLVVVCVVSNQVFARVFETPASVESSYITALILALIITPISSTHNVIFLTAAGGLAMASKYVLAIHKKHIFNPAAIAVLLTSIGAGESASWWVGSVQMLPLVVVGGVLVARKIRRLRMVAIFLVVAMVSTVFTSLLASNNPLTALQTVLLHSSLFFLAFVMFTEPVTTPPTTEGRDWYAVLVGALFPPQVHLFNVFSTPELVLSIGNVFSYLISPKVKLLPRLREKTRLAPDIVDFVFEPGRHFRYKAGQYVEVTLGHSRADTRGNRRYLTLASSPTEDTLRLGIKFYARSSSFKTALLGMNDTTQIAVAPPAGDFVLPKDTSRKLAFIAGGIGITPYRSMVKYMLDTDEHRLASLLYAEKNPGEFVYTDIFEEAQQRLGMQVAYVAQDAPDDWQGRRGYITADVIRAEVPDYQERLFYISGSYPMVQAIKRALRELDVPKRHIKTDYFPGYA